MDNWCYFPEDFHAFLQPIKCRRTATNEETPPQHFCDFHGKLITIHHILWHGTSEQRHSYRIPVHILRNTEQIAHTIFAQNL